MSKKYIKQIDNQNFVYPNAEVPEYDLSIIHDINNNSVSGVVTTLSATTFTSSLITIDFAATWSKNGAQEFIRPDGKRSLISVHMMAEGQNYYKPWVLVKDYSDTGTTSSSVSVSGTFNISPADLGLSGFTNGTYYFETRFIGLKQIYAVCDTLGSLVAPTPTPTPSITPTNTPTPTPTPSITPTNTPTVTPTASITPTVTPTNTATPTPTPTSANTVNAAIYASTDDPLAGANVVIVTYRINGGSWVNQSATVSSDPNSPSFVLNITLNSGDDLDIGLRDLTNTSSITAGYSATIPAGTTGTCGRSTPQSFTNVTSSITAYLNAQVITGDIVYCP